MRKSPSAEFVRTISDETARIWRSYSWPMRVVWLMLMALLAFGLGSVVWFNVLGLD